MAKKKDYCTQNNRDCETCSLVSYGRDCMNVPITAEVVTLADMVRKNPGMDALTLHSRLGAQGFQLLPDGSGWYKAAAV